MVRKSPAQLRADLQARTGVDFAEYADDEFVDTVTGWSGLLGLVKDLAIAVGAGLLLVIVAIILAVNLDLSGNASSGLVIGSVIAGAGVTALCFALLIRRRVPTEAAKVFDVAGRMADRVAGDLASGKLTIGVNEAARGVALVAAIPALTRATQRRFPLVGMIFAPAAGALVGRVIARVWPASSGSTPLTGLEKPTRQLEQTLGSVRAAVVPRLATAVRWVSLPLLLGGVVLIILGTAVALISYGAA